MDEAHQAASIEPSLTQFGQKLNELAQSSKRWSFGGTDSIFDVVLPNDDRLVQTIWSNNQQSRHQTEVAIGSSSFRRFD